jgi:hypothetical protein
MNFDKYCQEANEFMCKVSNDLENCGDTDHSYRVVRSVFIKKMNISAKMSSESSNRIFAHTKFCA